MITSYLIFHHLCIRVEETNIAPQWSWIYTPHRNTAVSAAVRVCKVLPSVTLLQPYREHGRQVTYSQSACIAALWILTRKTHLRQIKSQWNGTKIPFSQGENCLQWIRTSARNGLLFFFFLKKFYWSRADVQRRANLCSTAKWLSYTCI